MKKHLPIILAIIIAIAFGFALYKAKPMAEQADEHVERIKNLPDLDPKTLKPMETD